MACSRVEEGDCRCSAHGMAPLDPEMKRWGLPTPECPAAPYLLHDFPIQHQQWRAQGRVLVHCNRGTGLGDYLRGLPSAFILSLILELAFVVECDQVQTNSGLPMRLSHYLQRYFQGPHFNFSGSGVVNESVITYELKSNLMARHPRWSGVGGVRVYTNPSAVAKRLFMFNQAKLRTQMGNWTQMHWSTFEGCILRFLLAPSERLEKLLQAVTFPHAARLSPSKSARSRDLHSAPRVTNEDSKSGAGLLLAVAIHIRTGDAAFFNSSSSAAIARSWRWSTDVRSTLFSKDALLPMRCLLRASSIQSSIHLSRTVATRMNRTKHGIHQHLDASQLPFRCRTFDQEPDRCAQASVSRMPCQYTAGTCRLVRRAFDPPPDPKTPRSPDMRTLTDLPVILKHKALNDSSIGCLSCVVLSDSVEVIRCARSALEAPLIVPGQPVHTVANANDPSRNTDTNIDKVFLDWWLLALSAGTVWSENSAFLMTALRFKLATSSGGFEIDASNHSELFRHGGRGWRAVCDGTQKSLTLPTYGYGDRYWR